MVVTVMGDAQASGSSQPSRRRSPHEAEYRQGGRHAALAIEGLNARYGAGRVLFDVNLEVDAGETVALVGRNGAGKTTTLRSIMGIGGVTRTGSIRVAGRETIGMPAHRIARLGVGLVPEGRRVFGSLTVEENLRVAAETARRARGSEDGSPKESAWPLEMVFDVFPLLAEVRRSRGAWLSGGEQQILAIARALVADPKVLLLDEPSEGLAPRLVEKLVEQLRRVQRAGLAVLLAEQHAGLVKELASRVCVLERGGIRRGAQAGHVLGG
jgi:branched-chain amino acid transport system ATP-binding protein